MVKRLIFFGLIISVFAGTISAQGVDVATPSPAGAGARQNITNCDACGYCFVRQEQPGQAQAEVTQPAVPGNWETCRACLYPKIPGPATSNGTLIDGPTPDRTKYFTQIGCISSEAGGFTGAIVGFFFRIIGGIAFLYLIYGAIILATSRANPERLNYGRRVLIAAIVGLLFALGAVFAVNFISTGLGLGIGQ